MAEDPAAADRLAAPMNPQILLGEDDPQLAQRIRVSLERQGGLDVRVEGAPGAALPAKTAQRIDLVILDLDLQSSDDVDLLRRSQPATDAPLLDISTAGTEDRTILAFGMGADDFVHKPLSPRLLASRVRAHLRRFRRALLAPVGRLLLGDRDT